MTRSFSSRNSSRHSSSKLAIARNGRLFLLGAALFTLAVVPAHATSIDFSDFRDDGGSQSPRLQVDGVSVTVTASSGANFEFETAGCSGRSRHCRGDQQNGSNGRRNESITIQFDDGPARSHSSRSVRLGRRDSASVSTSGRGLSRRSNRGGTVAQRVALQPRRDGTSPLAGQQELTPIEESVDHEAIDSVRPVDPPVSNPVPEPTAALLFAAGLGIVAARGRR